MTTWVAPHPMFSPGAPGLVDGLAITLGGAVPDAMTSATPLGYVKTELTRGVSVLQSAAHLPDLSDSAVGLRAGPGAKTSIEDIQKKTAEFYKLDVKDFHSPQRARRVARPRQVAMYLARKLTTRSLPEIGRRFGGRDHTTVLHACRRIEALCEEDALFRQEVDFLSQMLQRRPEI